MIKVVVGIPTFLDLKVFVKQSAPYSRRFYYSEITKDVTLANLHVVACTIDGIGLMFKGFMKDVKEDQWPQIRTLLEDNHFIEVSEVYLK